MFQARGYIPSSRAPPPSSQYMAAENASKKPIGPRKKILIRSTALYAFHVAEPIVTI